MIWPASLLFLKRLRIRRGPVVFVALAFDGPSFLGEFLVFGIAACEGPVGIGAMSLLENLLRVANELGILDGKVLGFAGILGKVVNFNGPVEAGADRFPVLPTSGLLGTAAFVEFPVEVVALGSVAAFEVGEE